MYKSKIRLLLSSITILISGCVGNSNSQTSTTNNSNTATISSSITSSTIPAIEESGPVSLTSCYNIPNANVLRISTADNTITGTLTSCPSASFEIGYDGNKHWLQKEFYNTDGSALHLTFNTNVPQDYHLSQIYNDLNSANYVVGKIEQIDTSDCDKVIAAGNTSGQSCKIEFVYSGQATTENHQNIIHLVFNSKQNSQYNLDFAIPVTNNAPSVQNFPILNASGDTEDYSNYVNSISDTGYALLYNNAYAQQLENNGTGNITLANNDDQSTIQINTGKHFGNALNLAYGSPGGITSCADTAIGPQNICTFPFFNLDSTKSPEYTRFTYAYVQNTITGSKLSYSHAVVSGYGDILPQNFQITNTESPITLIKTNYGNDDIIYNIPLDNLKFTAELDPKLNIPAITNESSNILYYAIGDYANDSLQSLLKQISFTYDNNCFDGGFTNESSVNQSFACGVNIVLPAGLSHSGNSKPFGFQFYASYDAPSGDHIKELIGTVTVNLSQQ